MTKENKVVRGVVFSIILLLISFHRVNSQTLLDCSAIQKAVDQIPSSYSMYDWPTRLHVPGITFPQWTKLDPKDAIPMAEANDVLYSEIYYATIQADHYDYMLHGKPAPDKMDFENVWARDKEPIYEQALAKNLLEYEQTTLSGVLGQPKKFAIFRYRILDQHQTELRDKFTPEESTNSLLFSWKYVIHLVSSKGEYVDYPISFDGDMTRGVLAFIGSSVIVVTTGPLSADRGVVEIQRHLDDPVLARLRHYYPSLEDEEFSPTGHACNLKFKNE